MSDTLTLPELYARRVTLQFQRKMGKLKNIGELITVKKQIARLLTPQNNQKKLKERA